MGGGEGMRALDRSAEAREQADWRRGSWIKRRFAETGFRNRGEQILDECYGLEATSENQSWIAVEAPTVRNPGSSFASDRRHRRE